MLSPYCDQFLKVYNEKHGHKRKKSTVSFWYRRFKGSSKIKVKFKWLFHVSFIHLNGILVNFAVELNQDSLIITVYFTKVWPLYYYCKILKFL